MIKFKLINKNINDILILDSVTSEYLHYCLPDNIKYETINIRNNINIIFSFCFFLNFFIFFLKSHKIFLSNIIALSKVKKTKVIISFTDNNPLIGQIGKYEKFLRCIAIQNGTRGTSHYHGWKAINYFPHLYGFGKYEIDILNKMKKNVTRYKDVGSLKYGIFKKHFKNKLNSNNKKSIAFISTWRDTSILAVDQNTAYSNLIKLDSISKKLNFEFKIVLNYKGESQLQIQERQFYHSLLKTREDLFTNNSDPMNSYLTCENCDIVVTYASTLGFELYGAGKKVIFLGTLDSFKYEFKEIFNECLLNLPDLVKIKTSELSDFDKKINYLYNLSQEEYMEITRVSRKYYMNYQDRYAHEIIKDDINQYLKK